MAIIEELLRADENRSLSFGNYLLPEKAKKDGFAFGGNIYKVKTFKDITKLECNDSFLYESVPGTCVTEFVENDGSVSFCVEGAGDAQITVGMEDNTTYRVTVGDTDTNMIKTGIGGKLSFGVELTPDVPARVTITK